MVHVTELGKILSYTTYLRSILHTLMQHQVKHAVLACSIMTQLMLPRSAPGLYRLQNKPKSYRLDKSSVCMMDFQQLMGLWMADA